MKINNIKNISGLITFISENSGWSPVTVANAASALGYRKNGGLGSPKGLSSLLVDCAKHGAGCGIHGFMMYYETVKFFQENRRDIVLNIELSAKTLGKDTATMVRGFGVYRGQRPPPVSDIYRAVNEYRKDTR